MRTVFGIAGLVIVAWEASRRAPARKRARTRHAGRGDRVSLDARLRSGGGRAGRVPLHRPGARAHLRSAERPRRELRHHRFVSEEVPRRAHLRGPPRWRSRRARLPAPRAARRVLHLVRGLRARSRRATPRASSAAPAPRRSVRTASTTSTARCHCAAPASPAPRPSRRGNPARPPASPPSERAQRASACGGWTQRCEPLKEDGDRCGWDLECKSGVCFFDTCGKSARIVGPVELRRLTHHR